LIFLVIEVDLVHVDINDFRTTIWNKAGLQLQGGGLLGVGFLGVAGTAVARVTAGRLLVGLPVLRAG
jgi:hypothetical protein